MATSFKTDGNIDGRICLSLSLDCGNDQTNTHDEFET